MTNDITKYDDSSISSLQGAKQVRDKPANIFSTVDVWGAFHTANEVVANALDEIRAITKIMGHDKLDKDHRYKKLVFNYSKDKVLSLEDFGRGVPMAFNPNPREMKYNWHMVFNLLYAGGKYVDELDANGNMVASAYAESLGTNGLGATATQYASLFMDVVSKRDGKVFKVSFRQGKPLTNYIYKGQKVKFVLDMEFKELYHIGAEIEAETETGEKIMVVLEDFNPFDKSLGYKVDFDTAEKYGLRPVVTKEISPELLSKEATIADVQRYRETGEGLVDNIFDKLYHTVLEMDYAPEGQEKETGTKVTWKLDNEVFYDTNFTLQMFEDLLQTQAHVVSADIHFTSELHNVEKVYEGISTEHYFRSRIGEGNIITTMSMKDIVRTGMENNKQFRAKCDVVVAIHEEGLSRDLFLHNTSLITEEIHPLSVDNALYRFFDVIGKRTNLNIKQHEYRPYFSFMAESYMNANATSYKNQTKKGISNQIIGEMIQQAIYELLDDAYSRKEEHITAIVDKVVASVRDRKAYEQKKANANLVKKTTGTKHTVEKIAKCTATRKGGAELIIVEGDSATPPVTTSRDIVTQAVYTSKGKIINALKQPLDKVLKNDVVKDLINLIGVGVDLGDRDGSLGVYNYKKLNYEKIIIMTDADKDGAQIRVLLFLVFYVLMPDLLEKGHVYICESPLFRVVYKDGSIDYAYNEAEVKELVAASGKTLDYTDRIKGLGGYDDGELKHTAMNKEKRRLIPLQMDTDFYAVRSLVDTMFGNDMINKRKEIILNAIGINNADAISDEVSEVFDLDEVDTETAITA